MSIEVCKHIVDDLDDDEAWVPETHSQDRGSDENR